MKGLYVHIPYCVRKCGYCDFYSCTDVLGTRDAYIKAVLHEAGHYQGMSFETVYFGGGTPSLFGEHLPVLIEKLGHVFDLSGIKECSVEVNPESTTPEFLASIRSAGVTRISIGVQSLNDDELKKACRIHNANRAIQAIEMVKEAGFSSVSADLIVGLPGQTWLTLNRTLDKLLYLGVDHISLYCLSLEEGTPLAEDPPFDLPSDDTQAELFLHASANIKNNGFTHYEISNFAQPGHECLHNLNYWHNGDYLGLGPAAASHLDGVRFRNHANLQSYLDDPCGQQEDIEKLEDREKIAEEAMVRLRLLEEGVNPNGFSNRYDEAAVRFINERLAEMKNKGLLEIADGRYRLPYSRVLTSNRIFTELIG